MNFSFTGSRPTAAKETKQMTFRFIVGWWVLTYRKKENKMKESTHQGSDVRCFTNMNNPMSVVRCITIEHLYIYKYKYSISSFHITLLAFHKKCVVWAVEETRLVMIPPVRWLCSSIPVQYSFQPKGSQSLYVSPWVPKWTNRRLCPYDAEVQRVLQMPS